MPEAVAARARTKASPGKREVELLGRLARTEELILLGKDRIREQQTLIHSLKLRAESVKSAEFRLELLTESQALYEAQWRALLDALKR